MIPMMKKMIPRESATAVMILMNLSISIERGVGSEMADEAKLAICPMTVLSPVLMQIPLPFPAVHWVPKKMVFLVSRMF